MTKQGMLGGRVALVTRGSRGVGKRIAEALSEAGATVYVSGRTVAETDFAAECIPIPCDHTDDAQVESAFAEFNRSNPALQPTPRGRGTMRPRGAAERQAVTRTR